MRLMEVALNSMECEKMGGWLKQETPEYLNLRLRYKSEQRNCFLVDLSMNKNCS